jgi:hypothetical protein
MRGLLLPAVASLGLERHIGCFGPAISHQCGNLRRGKDRSLCISTFFPIDVEMQVVIFGFVEGSFEWVW